VTARPYGREVDWWSFGVTIYEALAAVHPFVHDEQEVLESMITRGIVHFPRFFSTHTVALLDGVRFTFLLIHSLGGVPSLTVHVVWHTCAFAPGHVGAENAVVHCARGFEQLNRAVGPSAESSPWGVFPLCSSSPTYLLCRLRNLVTTGESRGQVWSRSVTFASFLWRCRLG
jgi:serine/threonine protein kinase